MMFMKDPNLLFSVGTAVLITYLFSIYLRARDRGWSFRYMFQRLTYKIVSRMPPSIIHQIPEFAFTPVWPVIIIAAMLFLLSLKASALDLPGAFLGYVILALAVVWLLARMGARGVVEVRCHNCYVWVPMLSTHCPYCGSRIDTRRLHSPPQQPPEPADGGEIQPTLGEATGRASTSSGTTAALLRSLVFLAYFASKLATSEAEGLSVAVGIFVLVAGIVVVLGKILSTPAGAGEDKRKFICTGCGKTVAEDDVKCPQCGASFDDEAPNQPKEEPGQSGEPKRKFICTGCGNTVAQDDVKCPHCGAPFDDEAPNEPPEQPGQSGEHKREFMCTDCGKTVAEEDLNCPHCGASFDDDSPQKPGEDSGEAGS